MATTKTTRYVLEQQEEYEEAADSAYLDEQPADELAEPRCPTCGELLSWHEQECNSTPGPVSEKAAPVAATSYSYDVGQRVQPATGAQPHTVIWRGQLRERNPRTGLVLRVPVYRLNNDYWDCYREEELQAA